MVQMNNITRYSISVECGLPSMNPSKEGDIVNYVDHEALMKTKDSTINRMRSEINDLLEEMKERGYD